MKRILSLLAFVCLIVFTSYAGVPAERRSLYDRESPDSTRFQPDESIAFAVYDTLTLEMDLYFPADDAGSHRCIIYSYGGGFKDDNQRHRETRELCRRFADDGFVVLAANYRLGLRDASYKGVSGMVKPLENSIADAVEDVMKVTRYVIDYAGELTVDPSQIILMGSSAGAITSLQCEYERCNRTEVARRYLPDNFRYAGIVSLAGAIFAREGLQYGQDTPAPTLFLHGDADNLVTYGKIKFFSIGFYGSDSIVRLFKKNHWPYKIMRFTGEGHSVAARYFDNYEDVVWFIDNLVTAGRPMEIDETIYDPSRKRPAWDSAEPGALYK